MNFLNYDNAPELTITVAKNTSMDQTYFDSIDGYVFSGTHIWEICTDSQYNNVAKTFPVAISSTRLTLGFHANQNDLVPAKYFSLVRTDNGADSYVILKITLIINPATKRR